MVDVCQKDGKKMCWWSSFGHESDDVLIRIKHALTHSLANNTWKALLIDSMNEIESLRRQNGEQIQRIESKIDFVSGAVSQHLKDDVEKSNGN
jgi:hypothetical protein